MIRYLKPLIPVVLFLLLAAAARSTPSTSPRASGATPSLPNPGTITLDPVNQYSRLLAISDTHGSYDDLVQLLTAAKLIDSNVQWIGENIAVIVVGDSIDKGPKSLEIIDLWISLSAQAQAAGGKVVHLLGNHEAGFLACAGKAVTTGICALEAGEEGKEQTLIDELNAKGIPLTDLTGTSTVRGQFLHSEPIAAAAGKWLFFHAGLLPQMSWKDIQARAAAVLGDGNYNDPLLSDPKSMLEAKDWWADPAVRADEENRLENNGFFGVVFGHQPAALKITGRIGAVDSGHLIKIDTGMAVQAGAHSGMMLVFNNTSEMDENSFPSHVYTMGPDGTMNLLQPEIMPAP